MMLKSNKYFNRMKVFTLLLCCSMQILGQHSISKYERCWALAHPFAALHIKKQLPKAMLVYKQIEQAKLLDTLAYGGKLDAFRHTYVMAYLARSIKSKKLKKLGIAHEKGNKHGFYKNKLEFAERADSIACEMDLRNNELGFLIGTANKKTTDEELKQLILSEIKKGKAWYLKRNLKNEYLTCDNQVIHLLDYKGIWSVPKCLIKTNE
jgi:hypothetical protein